MQRDLSDRECTPLFLAAAADKGKLWIERFEKSVLTKESLSRSSRSDCLPECRTLSLRLQT